MEQDPNDLFPRRMRVDTLSGTRNLIVLCKNGDNYLYVPYDNEARYNFNQPFILESTTQAEEIKPVLEITQKMISEKFRTEDFKVVD